MGMLVTARMVAFSVSDPNTSPNISADRLGSRWIISSRNTLMRT